MLDGSDGVMGLDGSITFLDATSSDSAHSDGSPFSGHDAGADGALDGCTPMSTTIACGGQKSTDCSTCKFDIEWKCGDVTLRIGGACDPADSSSQVAGFYDGVCEENGKKTSSFDIPTTTCDCQDASALLTILQSQCTHQ